jgi:hypothetical protein
MVGITVALAAALVCIGARVPSSASPASVRVGAPRLTIVSQTAFVARDGEFAVRLTVGRAPTGAQLRLVLHQRVISRGELAATITDGPRRPTMFSGNPVPLADLPTRQNDGSVLLSLPIRSEGPVDPDRLSLEREGTYPIEIRLLDADGATVQQVLTYLILVPPPGDQSPPLSVGFIVDATAPLARRPGGATELSPTELSRVEALGAAFVAHPQVRATLAPTPETLDALATIDDATAGAALDAINDVADRSLVIARPYVDLDREGLLDRGLGAHVLREELSGISAATSVLGGRPALTTALAEPTLGPDALAHLMSNRVARVVVRPGGVAPLPPDTVDPSRWFVVGRDDTATMPAVEADGALAARLHSRDEPALVAQQLIAEVAALWFERPAIDRGVAVIVDPAVNVKALDIVLVAFTGARLVRPVTIPQLFDAVDPLTALDGGDDPVRRELTPAPGDDLTAFARELPDAEATVASYRLLLDGDTTRAQPLDRVLLVAAALRRPERERIAYLRSVRATIDKDVAAITVDQRVTVTLTAREGTIPLTLRNQSGHPVAVRVEFDSDKLDFPNGATVGVTLTDETTRLDLRVRTRASGAFPLDIAVRSPDGRLAIANARYTVRSTAVAGAGLVLSLGALVFLAVWWARHWRTSRRSRRLVAGDAHPSRQDGVG